MNFGTVVAQVLVIAYIWPWDSKTSVEILELCHKASLFVIAESLLDKYHKKLSVIDKVKSSLSCIKAYDGKGTAHLVEERLCAL